MIALRTVLVATDFSEPSDVAIAYGRVLANAFDATLHLLHVVPEALTLPWAAVTDGPSLVDTQRQWEKEATERLTAAVPSEFRDSTRVRLATRAGDPVREILGYASDHDVDLIVVGTHGRGFVAHVLLGSVAERVVRLAQFPVLTVHHPQHEFVTERLSAQALHGQEQRRELVSKAGVPA
jgi:nucleotide-binding universal stress UspA family protein